MALANLDWKRATALAEGKGAPAQAAVWTKRTGFFEGVKSSHCLALHEACVTTAPACTVRAILHAHPDAARTKETSYARLPLHCACRRAWADPEVIGILIAAHKAGCLVPDDLGRLPIYYALNSGASSTIIHLLLSAQPESARGVDLSGWTPLHVACAVGSTGAIRALLQIYPEAAILRTDKGSTPAMCLSKTMADRQEMKDRLKEARVQFDATFVNPLVARKTLLAENHDAVLV